MKTIPISNDIPDKSLLVYSFENVPGKKKMPKWARTAYYDDTNEDLTRRGVYIPAIAVEREILVLMCMSQDGEAGIMMSKHLYCHIDYLIKAFPSRAEVLKKVKNKVTAAVNEVPNNIGR